MRLDDQILSQTLVELGIIAPDQIPAPSARPLADELLERGLVTPDQIRRARDHLLGHSLPDEVRRAKPEHDLGKYVLVHELGHGGAGEVWKAWEKGLNRFVALKLIGPATPEARKRFLREAQVAAKLDHPNIVPVLDSGEGPRGLYVAMKFVDGCTLDRAPFDLKQKLTAVRDAARAIEYAHRQGVIHRDLKPENILVETNGGRVYVSDFGLAKQHEVSTSLSESGVVAGTPHYMPPEQAQGRLREVDARSDVYSLGATLYQLVAGRPPFEGEALLEILDRVIHADPVPPTRWTLSLPRDIEVVILKCLQKEPARRYASAQDFSDDLERCLAGEPILARPPSLVYRLARGIRRNASTVVAITLATALAAGALVVWAFVREQAQRLDEERAAALELVRRTARDSLDVVLKMRRQGSNEGMRLQLPVLENAFRSAIERAPSLAEPYYLMGRMHRALMEDERAVDFQNRALEKDPNFAPALYERAILQSRKYGREVRLALLSLTAIGAMRSDPTQTRDRIERDKPELKALRESILGDLKRLEQLQLPDTQLRVARGILALHEWRRDEARTLLEEAVKKEPLMEEAWEALGEALFAGTGDKEKLWKEAEDRFTEGLGFDRGYVPLWLGRGKVRNDRGSYRLGHGQDALPDLKGAEEDFSEAFRLGSMGFEAKFYRGVLRSNRGVVLAAQSGDPMPDYDASEKDLTDALGLKPNHVPALIRRGATFANRGSFRINLSQDPLPDYAAAEKDYTQALSIQPEASEALMRRGALKSNRGVYRMRRGEDPMPDYASSEKDFDDAIQRDRELWEAWMKRGVVKFNRGQRLRILSQDPLPDYAGSERDLTEALRLKPDLAQAYFERGRMRELRAGFRLAKQDEPAARRDYQDASADFLEAMRINPSLKKTITERMDKWPPEYR